MEHDKMMWSEMSRNKYSVPLFWYQKLKWVLVSTLLFGNTVEWDRMIKKLSCEKWFKL